jgi:glycerol-3-phosphate acyltransferase PlsX
VVCDGFLGNVILKVSESLAETIGQFLKQELKANLVTGFGALLSKPAFSRLKKRLDYAEYGGAPLLGVRGVCIIGHGSSSPKAIKNALKLSETFVNCQINQQIEQRLPEA